MKGRKQVITHRMAEAAFGRNLSGSARAKSSARSSDSVRVAAARIESFSGSKTRLHKPQRAFVCLDVWDEKLDGKLDPSMVTKTYVDGVLKDGVLENAWQVRRVFWKTSSQSKGSRRCTKRWTTPALWAESE